MMTPEQFDKYLKAHKNVVIKEFENKVKNGADLKLLIKKELAQIKEFENSVDEYGKLYDTSSLTEYKEYRTLPNGVMQQLKWHKPEFEYLRYKTGYYNVNPN